MWAQAAGPSMWETAVVAILGAVVGAVVGGFATLTGSVLVARGEATRQARIDMFMVLLPSIHNAVTRPPILHPGLPEWARPVQEDRPRPVLHELIEEIRRTCVIAGKRDVRDAAGLISAHETYRALWTRTREDSDLGMSSPDDPDSLKQRQQEHEKAVNDARVQIDREAERLMRRLEKRIR